MSVYRDAYSTEAGPVRGAFRMGLRPIDAADWLPKVDEADARLRTRRTLLARAPRAHHRCPKEALAAASELLALVDPEAAPTDAPLLAVAERIPDDICLLTPAPTIRLRAAVLTAASSWRLGDKLGQDLRTIHAPVAGLDARIGDRMQTFLERLPADRVFERSNWSFYDDGAFDRSDGGALATVPRALGRRPEVAERLWLRMERQTLRRLPVSDWIVFTIRIHRHPITDLKERPEDAANLRLAMASLDAEERRARRLDHVGPGLDAWLARVCVESAA